MESMKLTKSERETLKAVYRLTKGDEPAHTGDLADKLEVGRDHQAGGDAVLHEAGAPVRGTVSRYTALSVSRSDFVSFMYSMSASEHGFRSAEKSNWPARNLPLSRGRSARPARP